MMIYGFFAAVIAKNLFATQDQLAGIISAFAISSIGYLARSLSAFFFEPIGEGFSCSGGLTGWTIFTVEHAPEGKRGFHGSVAMAGLL